MKRPKGNNNLIRKETYRVVIGAKQLVFVYAEDHVADGESGLKKNKKKKHIWLVKKKKHKGQQFILAQRRFPAGCPR